jgi:hypothetical protein
MVRYGILGCLIFILSCDQINDPEQPAIIPRISIEGDAQDEGSEISNFDFVIRLSEPTTATVSVDFQTKSVSATEGEDYTGLSGSFTLNPGSIEAYLTIEVLGDTIKEENEEFQVVLSNPINATINISSAIGIIRNDDAFLYIDDGGYISADSYEGMELVWADEFEETTINSEYWTHELGASGWGNNELQNYTSSTDNSFINTGKLVIEANNKPSGGASYSSARMVSKGKQSFQYGRIDIRAKLPEGQGIWPALWMLGDNIDEVGWPACGELDIMELVGHLPSTLYGTAHWGAEGQGFSTYRTGEYELSGAKFSDAFHVFSLEWEEDKVVWLLDDEPFHEVTKSSIEGAAYRFNAPFFFIMNIAVGGNWPGAPDASTKFPQRMFIDYVRVFQKQ